MWPSQSTYYICNTHTHTHNDMISGLNTWHWLAIAFKFLYNCFVCFMWFCPCECRWLKRHSIAYRWSYWKLWAAWCGCYNINSSYLREQQVTSAAGTVLRYQFLRVSYEILFLIFFSLKLTCEVELCLSQYPLKMIKM